MNPCPRAVMATEYVALCYTYGDAKTYFALNGPRTVYTVRWIHWHRHRTSAVLLYTEYCNINFIITVYVLSHVVPALLRPTIKHHFLLLLQKRAHAQGLNFTYSRYHSATGRRAQCRCCGIDRSGTRRCHGRRRLLRTWHTRSDVRTAQTGACAAHRGTRHTGRHLRQVRPSPRTLASPSGQRAEPKARAPHGSAHPS